MPSARTIGRIVLGAMIAAGTVTALVVIGGFGFLLFVSSTSKSISPDLSFHVTCEGSEPNPSDERIGAFLRQRGFAVLDKVRLARKLGETPLLTRDVVALDNQDREIALLQLPIGSPDLSVMLRSRPPTQRDEELEDALLAFARETPGCRVRHVNRRENKAELRAFHDDLIAMARTWFKRDAATSRGARRMTIYL